jgi:hypothetical protein
MDVKRNDVTIYRRDSTTGKQFYMSVHVVAARGECGAQPRCTTIKALDNNMSRAGKSRPPSSENPRQG